MSDAEDAHEPPVSAFGIRQPLKPVSTPNGGQKKWQPVSVVQGLVSVKGGYNGRGDSAKSIQYQVGATTRLFVELDKTAHWFLKGVGGPLTQKGDLKAVNVLKVLREQFDLAMISDASEDSPQSRPAASDSQDTDDPMDAMEAMDSVNGCDAPDPQRELKSKTRKKSRQHPGRATVVEFEVPTRPECTGIDKDEKTVVSVYKSESSKRKDHQLYLRDDCIGWLLAYAADELSSQGVQPASPAPKATIAGNCPAVADLRLEWDFSSKSWEGNFVAGELVGTTRRMSMTDLNDDVWALLGEESRRTDIYLSKGPCDEMPWLNITLRHATHLQRKLAAKEFMIMWCSAIARNKQHPSPQQDSIVAKMDLIVGKRGEKRSLEDTVVTVAGVGLTAAVAATADEVADTQVSTPPRGQVAAELLMWGSS